MFSQARTQDLYRLHPEPVGWWIDRMLFGDSAGREAAGDVLWMMWLGVFPVEGGPEPETFEGGGREAFDNAVRVYFDGPLERRARYHEAALRLVWTGILIHKRKMEIEFGDKQKSADRQFDEVLEKIQARLELATDESAKAALASRAERALLASVARDCARWKASDALGNESTNEKVMAGYLLEADAARFVVERRGDLEAMRADADARWRTHHLLEAAGPAAGDLLPTLYREYLVGSYERDQSMPATVIAAVGRGSAWLKGRVLDDLEAGHAMAPPLLNLLGQDASDPRVEAQFLRLVQSDDNGDQRTAFSLITALPDRAVAVEPLLRATRGDSYLAGDAILHLRDVAPLEPERVVSRLIELFDDFEEYDPDYSYDGQHERVCHALTTYGPLAAPAVPRIGQYLRLHLDGGTDCDWPKDACETIVAIGPGAGALLPMLMELRGDDEDLDAETSPLDAAIVMLRR